MNDTLWDLHTRQEYHFSKGGFNPIKKCTYCKTMVRVLSRQQKTFCPNCYELIS